jgi:hypothetical protein
MLLSLIASLSLAGPLVLVHTMPWYESKPVSGKWGWHWTMNKTDPDNGELATHYRPLLGAYDSNDPQTVDCQVLLMKLAGIDGVTIDWYGTVDHFDYAVIHRNTQRLIRTVKRAGMKFAIVYEDQTVPNLIKGGKFPAERAVEEGAKVMQWVGKNWFRDPAHLRWKDRPVLMVFGPQYYKEDDWTRMFAGLDPQPAFLTLHHRKGPAAVGAFDWPLPQGGTDEALRKIDRFQNEAKGWTLNMPVAFPRFHDYYKEAGVSEGYDTVEDREGKTYRETLTRALRAGAPFVQIATWNDWGEGTGIEPTQEFGFRDLETTQRLLNSKYTPADLRLPLRLYELQKQNAGNRAMQSKLARISDLLFKGKPKEARVSIRSLGRS